MTILKKPRILYWTHHARAKMRQYRLSESRVKRIIYYPWRTEEGIAPKTIALMQPASLSYFAKASKDKKTTVGRPTWKQELWVMIEDRPRRRKIISAWRYPGQTKPRSDTTFDFLGRAYKDYLAAK